MNQILTEKWFLLQNIKDSSYFRNGVFKLKQVGMQPEILLCIPDICRHTTKMSKPSLI
jgi:hypothetical protein